MLDHEAKTRAQSKQQKAINDFIKEKIDEFSTYKFKDDNLWEAYQDEFRHLKEDFKLASQPLLRSLRSYLRTHGVWVRWERDTSLSSSLFYKWTEKVPTKWTKEEVLQSNESFDSVKIIHLPKPSQIQSAQTTTGCFPSKDQKYDNKFESSRSITPSRDPLTQSFPSIDPTKDQKGKVKFEPQYPTIGYSRELSALSKMYDPDLKYHGDNDSFDFKLNIFFGLCNKADIPEPLYGKAYSTILSGPALTHYYSVTSNCTRVDFDKLCIATRDQFEGLETNRNRIARWDSLSLCRVMAENEGKGKSALDCLTILIKELRFLQLSFDPEYRTDIHLYLKLIKACRSIPACQLSCFKPSETVNGLINDLQASIYTFNQNDEAPTPQFFTDRRYHNEIRRESTQPSKHPFVSRNQTNPSRSDKKCYVCNRSDCWSNNHTESERNDAKRDFKKSLYKRFDKKAEQFLARMEDNQDDLNSSDSDLNEQIETLILDTRNSSECLNEVEEHSDIFITSFGLVQEANPISHLYGL